MARFDPTVLDPKIANLNKRIVDLKTKHEQVVKEVQKACAHPAVGECYYRQFESGGSMSPARVCLRCGLSEYGWNFYVLRIGRPLVPGPGIAGLGALAKTVHHMDREDLYKRRQGLLVHGRDQGPLARGEITIQQLIDDPKCGKPFYRDDE